MAAPAPQGKAVHPQASSRTLPQLLGFHSRRGPRRDPAQLSQLPKSPCAPCAPPEAQGHGTCPAGEAPARTTGAVSHLTLFILALLSKGAPVRFLLVPTLGLYPLAVPEISRASFLRLTTSPSLLVLELPSAHTPGRGQAANCGFGKHAAQHPIPGSSAFAIASILFAERSEPGSPRDVCSPSARFTPAFSPPDLKLQQLFGCAPQAGQSARSPLLLIRKKGEGGGK